MRCRSSYPGLVPSRGIGANDRAKPSMTKIGPPQPGHDVDIVAELLYDPPDDTCSVLIRRTSILPGNSSQRAPKSSEKRRKIAASRRDIVDVSV